MSCSTEVTGPGGSLLSTDIGEKLVVGAAGAIVIAAQIGINRARAGAQATEPA
jgi:hypothetical protein